MKHLIAAIVFLAAISLGAWFCTSYTNTVSETLLDSLDICEKSVHNEEWTTALDDIHLTTALWDEYKPRLAVFLYHDILDDINDRLYTVSACVTTKDKTGFIIENKRLTALVDEIGKMDNLTFENLF